MNIIDGGDSVMSSDEKPPSPEKVDLSNYSSEFSLKNRIARFVWGLVWFFLFRPSPRFAMGWRRFLLRLFGARVGHGAHVYPDARVWAPWNLEMGDFSCLGPGSNCYCVARIRIGAHATISQFAYLCSAGHDIKDPHMRLLRAPIVIEDGAWVCAGAYVGPGIAVRRNGVLAAMACLTRELPEGEVWGGNPAVFLKQRNIKH